MRPRVPSPTPLSFLWGGGGDPKSRNPFPGGRGTPAGLRPDCDGDPDSNDYYKMCTPLFQCLLIHSLSLLSPPLQDQRSSCSGGGGRISPTYRLWRRDNDEATAATTGREENMFSSRPVVHCRRKYVGCNCTCLFVVSHMLANGYLFVVSHMLAMAEVYIQRRGNGTRNIDRRD